MAEDTIVFPDLSLMEQIDALLPALGFPASTEVEVEPALDYPGQQLAIDIYAPTDGELHTAVEAIRAGAVAVDRRIEALWIGTWRKLRKIERAGQAAQCIERAAMGGQGT